MNRESLPVVDMQYRDHLVFMDHFNRKLKAFKPSGEVLCSYELTELDDVLRCLVLVKIEIDLELGKKT